MMSGVRHIDWLMRVSPAAWSARLRSNSSSQTVWGAGREQDVRIKRMGRIKRKVGGDDFFMMVKERGFVIAGLTRNPLSNQMGVSQGIPAFAGMTHSLVVFKFILRF
jgi:hypothetical protein